VTPITLAYLAACLFLLVTLKTEFGKPSCINCGARRPDMHHRSCPMRDK